MSTLLSASNLEAFSGDTLSLVITVLDDADLAVDLSGATVRFSISRRIGGTVSVSTEDSPATAAVAISPNSDSPAVNNIVTVSVTAANTEALSGVYRWECKATDASGNEAVVAYGTINFIPNQID